MERAVCQGQGAAVAAEVPWQLKVQPLNKPIERIIIETARRNINTCKSRYNTPSECIRRCKEVDEGYAYAGVQYGRQCYCGNEAPPVDTFVEQNECNWSCSGDSSLMCGALWRMNVYETGTRYC